MNYLCSRFRISFKHRSALDIFCGDYYCQNGSAKVNHIAGNKRLVDYRLVVNRQ